jgi:hypothetical protein
MKINGTSGYPTVRVDSMLVSMLSFSDISRYLCLPHMVHFGIEPFWWHITVEAMLRGTNMGINLGSLPHQPSCGFDDV